MGAAAAVPRPVSPTGTVPTATFLAIQAPAPPTCAAPVGAIPVVPSVASVPLPATSTTVTAPYDEELERAGTSRSDGTLHERTPTVPVALGTIPRGAPRAVPRPAGLTAATATISGALGIAPSQGAETRPAIAGPTRVRHPLDGTAPTVGAASVGLLVLAATCVGPIAAVLLTTVVAQEGSRTGTAGPPSAVVAGRAQRTAARARVDAVRAAVAAAVAFATT